MAIFGNGQLSGLIGPAVAARGKKKQLCAALPPKEIQKSTSSIFEGIQDIEEGTVFTSDHVIKQAKKMWILS